MRLYIHFNYLLQSITKDCDYPCIVTCPL